MAAVTSAPSAMRATRAALMRVHAALGTAPVRAGLRVAAGAGILLALALMVGAEPFVRGLAAVSPLAVVVAVALGAVATVAATWRWRVVAAGLGLDLPWAHALPAYYRSQFLNSVLPGGVIGDVDRVVRHAGRIGRTGPAARAVVIERTLGVSVQVAQLVVALAVFATVAPRTSAPLLVVPWGLAVAAVVFLVVLAVAARASARLRGSIRRGLRHGLRRELALLRTAVGTPRAVVAVAGASVVAVSCHVATFLVACAAVGVDAASAPVVVVALVAVLAGSVPLSVGGWGPREGVAAGAFAALGMSAATGVAASTAFGVLALIAVAPGALVVAASARRRRASPARGAAAASTVDIVTVGGLESSP